MDDYHCGPGPGQPRSTDPRSLGGAERSASEIYARTARHPTLAGLPAGLAVHSFDDVYESVPRVRPRFMPPLPSGCWPWASGREGVIYAVPGHPAVGEATVGLIQARRRPRPACRCALWPGCRSWSQRWPPSGWTRCPTLQIADALDLAARHHPPFHPDAPALVAQLYSAAIAGDVKLTLMNQYPDEHEVALMHAAGHARRGQVERLPLYEIDRTRTSPT